MNFSRNSILSITAAHPILGINAPVLIAHGISNDIAIKNLILHTAGVINGNVCEKLKEAFK